MRTPLVYQEAEIVLHSLDNGTDLYGSSGRPITHPDSPILNPWGPVVHFPLDALHSARDLPGGMMQVDTTRIIGLSWSWNAQSLAGSLDSIPGISQSIFMTPTNLCPFDEAG